MKNAKITKADLIAFLLLGIISVCIFIRCFYSFTWSDESYYLAVTHRFWLGERMIADEWFTSQLSAPLMLPFYSLFQWITGGNDGVYLYFRLLYWGISTITAVMTYRLLRRQNSILPSLACSFIYIFYSRANIGGMSYYNMTLTFVLLAVLLIYDQFDRKKPSRVKLYLTGIFLALAIVNTPYLAFPYLLIGVVLLISKKCWRYRKEVFRGFAGTAFTGIGYLGYVFYKVPVREIIINIPHILNEPELQRTNPVMVIPLIIARIVWRYVWTIGVIACIFVYIRYRKQKKKEFTAGQIKGIITVNLLVFIINSYLSSDLIGCINIAGTLFFGSLLYLLYDRKAMEKNTLILFLTAGFSMVLGFSFSSDTGLDAMSVGFVLIAMGVLTEVFKLKEVKKNQFLLGTVVVVVSVMIIQTGILRLFSVYRDAPIGQLNEQIADGPGKYLYTTKEHERQYSGLKQAIEEYVREEDIVFYSKSCYWSYLCTNNEYGTPSSWRMALNSSRLEEYFSLNPQKIPTCIFVLNPLYGSYESSMIQNNEKEEFPNTNTEEGFLYDYITENNYEKIELECATIYRSRKE